MESQAGMTANTIEQSSPVLTRERLVGLQTLEVEITANFEASLQALREATGANLQPRSDGYHLTIINPTESKQLSNLDDATIAELQRISTQIQHGEGITVKGVGFIDGASASATVREADKEKKTAFIALDIPALQAFRGKVGLPPRDFHITLGFVGADIHMQVLRREPVKSGSPKLKEITAPIPKQADPHFNSVTLPEIHFGGLTGQTKERK